MVYVVVISGFTFILNELTSLLKIIVFNPSYRVPVHGPVPSPIILIFKSVSDPAQMVEDPLIEAAGISFTVTTAVPVKSRAEQKSPSK